MSKLNGSLHALPVTSKISNASHPEQKIEVTVKFKMDENFQINPEAMEKFGEIALKNKVFPTIIDYDTGSVHLTGLVSDLEKFFGITLNEYIHSNGYTFRHFESHINVPDEFENEIIAVLGLSTHFRAKSHHRILNKNITYATNQSAPRSYYPEQVAKLYNFPTGDGSGQCVGIIELGGGYNLDDLKTYMMNRNLPLPNVVSVNIGHGSNNPSDIDASGEVCLDVDVIVSITPKAKVIVYFADNTDNGFSNAVSFAINDKVNNPKTISISWGSAENNYSQQAIAAFEQDFSKAVSLGINIYTAAGDNGANDNESSPITDYPSSSPNCISCGGTRIVSVLNGEIKEVVWNDGIDGGATGGGVSKIFNKPSYQSSVGLGKHHNNKGRNVPDISSTASPYSGFNVNVNGTNQIVGGTSGSSPLWASLNILLNENLGKNIGWINPILYKNGSAMNDITEGNNGAYSAQVKYDNCTGWGTPNGKKLLKAIKK